MTTTQQGEQPLVYTTGRHWPVLITSPYDTEPDEVETVQAPTYADAVRSAAYSYQAPYTAHVIPIPVNEHISAGPDPEEVTTPAVVQLAQALLAAHAPGHEVVSAEDRTRDRLTVMRIAAEAMRERAQLVVINGVSGPLAHVDDASRAQAAAAIRALPLPADNEHENADPCRSFTTLDAIETYCEHDSGDGHNGHHYAVVNGKTHTWKGNGTRTIRVQRACNGCGSELRDVNEAELDAAMCGRPLPDVTGECPTCTPRTTAHHIPSRVRDRHGDIWQLEDGNCYRLTTGPGVVTTLDVIEAEAGPLTILDDTPAARGTLTEATDG